MLASAQRQPPTLPIVAAVVHLNASTTEITVQEEEIAQTVFVFVSPLLMVALSTEVLATLPPLLHLSLALNPVAEMESAIPQLVLANVTILPLHNKQ